MVMKNKTLIKVYFSERGVSRLVTENSLKFLQGLGVLCKIGKKYFTVELCK